MKRKIGIGTPSLILSAFQFFFMYTHKGNPSLGDNIVSAAGLAPWSGDNPKFHTTILYSIPIVLLAAVLGYVYPNDYGSHAGRNVAILWCIIIVGWLLFRT